MRKYTNKNGEIISVSEDHLNTAVKIKKELQMSSPSFRCNWNQHKKFMEKEGFYDSEASENYRLLIKNYQKTIGQLDDKEKYANLVSERKLESIKEAVGEMAYVKREIQLENQKLGKLKRDLTLYGVVADSIAESFKNIDIRTPKVNYIGYEVKDREILVLPSDWHIGYEDEDYSHEKALEKIDNYILKIIEYAKAFDVNTFHVVHLGDIVENLYMHKNTQSFNAEFTFAEQIVKATETFFYLIESLSVVGKVVYHGVVRGNHGRMSTKGETVSKDCAEYIVHEQIKTLIIKSKNTNISIEESGYNVERSIFEVKGKTIKAIHGDRDGQSDRSIIQKHISLENKLIDVLCMGHFHNYKLSTENFGRLVYQSGCLQGATDYSKSLKFNSPSSQGVIVVGENEVIPINIFL